MSTPHILLLPTDAAPIENYQHIISRIQSIWEYPEIVTYLDKLIVNGNDDTRLHRLGFPHDAISDLMSLYVLANNIRTVQSPSSIW
jgi:hypothetical protein